MKKTIALFLTVLLFLLCFTSCGTSGTETIKTKIGGVKTSIEYKSVINDYREDLIVLNLEMTGGEKYNEVRIFVQYHEVIGGIIPGMSISTPDTEIQRGDFSAEYEFDGEFETSVIIDPCKGGGLVFDYDDVRCQKIKIGLFLGGDSDEAYWEGIIYVTGDEETLFLSKDEDTAKYRAINHALEYGGEIVGGSKLEAFWLFLTGKL